MFKILNYRAYKQFHDKHGNIIKSEVFLESGVIDCEYIPEIIEYETVYTDMDLNGPIFVYENCKVLKTFGPIKKNSKFEVILLDYNTKCIHIDFGKKNDTIRLILEEGK